MNTLEYEIMIPEEVYFEICDYMDEEVLLFGIA